PSSAPTKIETVPHPRDFWWCHPPRLAVLHRSTKGSGRYSRHEEHSRHERRACPETSGSIPRTADIGPEQWRPCRPYAAVPEESETVTRWIPSSFRLRCS